MDNLATSVSLVLRRTRRRYLTLRAKMTGRAFYCEALAGNSRINISINEEARRQAGQYRLPAFVMMENTSACNLRCVSCPRHAIRRLRRKLFMSPEDVRKVAGRLKEAGVKKVAYLNLGEPFLSRNLRQELETVRELNPGIEINTSTNGVLIDSDSKREAALLFNRMQISLDGISNKMVNRYQRGSNFAKAYQNMADLVAYRDTRGRGRPRIVWKYLLFRWNEAKRHVRKAIAMARQAAVDEILLEKTVSPFYGIPYRSYWGLHNTIGHDAGGGRVLVLRPETQEPHRSVPS